MGKHIVAEADKTVSELVDLALSGEPVTITRDGKPVAELAPVKAAASHAERQRLSPEEAAAWLEEAWKSLPKHDVDTVALIRAMRDEEWH